MSGELLFVRAGAGSGKTFFLCDELEREVLEGGLDPARILATTFTRKAAAELKGRIQARLLGARPRPGLDPVALAERLDLATIGTVHSVGQQLLARFAVEMGLSPRLHVIEEERADKALRDLMGEMELEPWQRLGELSEALSQGEPQERVAELLVKKRSNRIPDEALGGQLAAAVERYCMAMAPEGVRDDAADFEQLYAVAEVVLPRLAAIETPTDGDRKAMGALRGIVTRRARVWSEFAQVMGLAGGKKAGGDEILEPLRRLARTVYAAPALHQALREYVAALAERVAAVEHAYRRFKEERGFVDFTDLETLLLELLERPELAATLAAELRVVVVDEFQDTSPLQLAIFQRLRALAEKSRWVGDPKQSIFEFRDAVPTVVEGLWKRLPGSARSELGASYRSVPALVRLVGTLFAPIFGPEARLEPMRADDPSARAVERWVVPGKPPNAALWAAIAAGVEELLGEGLRPRDIAILAYANDHAAAIGEACSRRGIPALVVRPGLLSTREGALVLAGLRLVADRGDALAAAHILHLTGDDDARTTPRWFEERLRAVQARDEAVPPWEDVPCFGPLAGIDASTIPPSAVVERVIAGLDLPGRIAGWGGIATRAANLDTLVAVACEWQEQARDLGQAPTLVGLIAQLEAMAEAGEDEVRPPFGVDAVTVLTYHRAKGLEWPVVVLTDLDRKPQPRLWEAVVSGGSEDAEDPLAGRSVRLWPWPFGGLSKGVELEERALESADGEEAKRREEAEKRRLLYVGMTRARDRLVLAHGEGKQAWLRMIPKVDDVLPVRAPGIENDSASDGAGPVMTTVELELEGIGATYVLRRIEGGRCAEEVKVHPRRGGEEWWLERPRVERATVAVPRFVSPNRAAAEGMAASFEAVDMGGTRWFPEASSEDEERRLGDAVHGYLAALPSLAGVDEEARVGVAARCLEAHGVARAMQAEAVVAVGERLARWVAERYPDADWRTEVPVVAARAGGGSWRGEIDLLLHLADGGVVVVDHKCGPLRPAEYRERAARYAGQLAAYREALQVLGHRMRETWIHFGMAGMMVKVE